MELRTVEKLLKRYLEADTLTDEEGERLLAGLEHLIESGQYHQLVGIKYRLDEESILTEEDLKGCYWEIHMYYGDFEGDDHHHHHDDDDHDHRLSASGEPGFIHKWGWLCVILAGLLSAAAYILIRKYKL
jgi:hypothetical protein